MGCFKIFLPSLGGRSCRRSSYTRSSYTQNQWQPPSRIISSDPNFLPSSLTTANSSQALRRHLHRFVLHHLAVARLGCWCQMQWTGIPVSTNEIVCVHTVCDKVLCFGNRVLCFVFPNYFLHPRHRVIKVDWIKALLSGEVWVDLHNMQICAQKQGRDPCTAVHCRNTYMCTITFDVQQLFYIG